MGGAVHILTFMHQIYAKKHQHQLAGGCGSMSDVRGLPITISCVLKINKTTEQIRSTECTRVGTLIVATIYLQLIQNRYMFQSFTVLQCSHQHCVQPVASDVEVVGYL